MNTVQKTKMLQAGGTTVYEIKLRYDCSTQLEYWVSDINLQYVIYFVLWQPAQMIGEECNMSTLKRGHLNGEQILKASVMKTPGMFDVSLATVSSVMAVYAKLGETSLPKRNSGWNTEIIDDVQWALRMIGARQYKTTVAKETVKLNTHYRNTVSIKNNVVEV